MNQAEGSFVQAGFKAEGWGDDFTVTLNHLRISVHWDDLLCPVQSALEAVLYGQSSAKLASHAEESGSLSLQYF